MAAKKEAAKAVPEASRRGQAKACPVPRHGIPPPVPLSRAGRAEAGERS